MTSSRCSSQKQHIDKMIDVTARLHRQIPCDRKVTGDLARREHSGGQNHQDEGEEKQLLNILEGQPSDQSNRNSTDSRFLLRRFQLSKPSRKPWRFTKLKFIDISVNLQKLFPTVPVPHVQHKGKSPMRTVQRAEEESYSIFDWDS